MKKITALALALAMALSLTACGGGGSSTPSTSNPTPSSSGGGSTGGADLSNLSVTCVVPYDAGGGTDAVMRGLADAAKGSFKNISRELNRSSSAFTVMAEAAELTMRMGLNMV